LARHRAEHELIEARTELAPSLLNPVERPSPRRPQQPRHSWRYAKSLCDAFVFVRARVRLLDVPRRAIGNRIDRQVSHVAIPVG
jgi:hypothetical protein